MQLRSERSATVPRLTPEAPEEHSSLALPRLLGRLSPEEKTVIVDLGAPSEGNLRYLSQYRCRLHIGDIFDALLSAGALGNGGPDGEEPDIEGICREAMSIDDDERVDLILAWNLFDYLRPDQITRLASVLAPHCHAKTALFALVTYRQQMPARPGRYEVVSPELLHYRASGVAVESSPRYKEPALTRALPGFVVDQSFLLRHGQHEYIFSWQGESA
ncbi:MAG: hypothetical protein ACRD2Z_17225 [Thermoanaerobaculia bacterium]